MSIKWDDEPAAAAAPVSGGGKIAWDDEKPQTPAAPPPVPAGLEASVFNPNRPGELESFARGAVRNFPLAPQAVAGLGALAGGDYSQELADFKKKAELAKAVNPKSYGAGAVTGALAPMAIPYVGPALKASPIAANATLGVANALSEADLAKTAPSELAKQATIGGTIGGALGGAAKFAGALGEAGPRLEAEATNKMLNLGTSGANKLVRGTLANPEEAVMQVNQKLNKLFPKMFSLTDDAGSKYQKLLNAHEAAGQTIGQIVDTTSSKAGRAIPEADAAIQKLRQAAQKYAGYESAPAKESLAALADEAKKLETLQKEGNLSFKAFQDLKMELGDLYHNTVQKNPGVDTAYGILSDTMDDILQRVHPADTAMKPAMDHAKEVFNFTGNLLPAMKRGVSREVAGAGGRLADLGLGAIALTGNPIPALAAYAAKHAMKAAYPELGQNVAYEAINALRKIPTPNLPPQTGPAIQATLNDYLTSKFGNKKNVKQ